jgi:cephalosporin-C deacetylase
VPRFDLSPAELADYAPDVREPADFDDFWAATIADSRRWDAASVITPVETPYTLVDVFDVTFPGFGGDPVKAWLTLPAGAQGPLPAVVEYQGYGGGRGLPGERINWAVAGFAHLFMDTRAQGSMWGSGGDTADPHGTGPSSTGFMTRGIEEPATYYYRRVFTDAVRAVDAMRALPQVDADRVAVCGASQGGGIAIAAAGLSDGLVAVMPDVPFLCHFERAVGLTDADPYQEVVRYLSVHRGRDARVFETLSYFDGVNMAKRTDAAALYSVALMDTICPPSTVYAAYNRHATATKQIEVYTHNGHEGGQAFQFPKQARFLRGLL